MASPTRLTSTLNLNSSAIDRRLTKASCTTVSPSKHYLTDMLKSAYLEGVSHLISSHLISCQINQIHRNPQTDNIIFTKIKNKTGWPNETSGHPESQPYTWRALTALPHSSLRCWKTHRRSVIQDPHSRVTTTARAMASLVYCSESRTNTPGGTPQDSHNRKRRTRLDAPCKEYVWIVRTLWQPLDFSSHRPR